MTSPFTWGSALLLLCLLAGTGALLAARFKAAGSSQNWPLLPQRAGPPPATVVSTLAGEIPNAEWVDGPKDVATFREINDLAVDAQGNVYVADSRAVRKITPSGQVSTLAGEPAPRMVMQLMKRLIQVEAEDYGMHDGRGSVAKFGHLNGIAVGPDGTVFVSDNETIRRISTQGDVTTLAGKHRVKGTADGQGAQARFGGRTYLAVDGQGNVYVADILNHTIRKITPAGLVSTYAGKAGEDGHADGPRTQARFDRPEFLKFAPDGSLYVHDRENRTFRRISPQGEVTTWGGHPSNVKRGTGPGAALEFDYHSGLAIDQAGFLYTIRDSKFIRRIRLSDGAEQPYTSTADERGQVDAATLAAARFNFPDALATGPDGSLYVADKGNGVVRKISPLGVVSTLAGRNLDALFNNPADRKRLHWPSGIALDQQGNLLVADRGNAIIRRVSLTGEISTLAGQNMVRGYANGTATEAKFSIPTDVAAGPNGVVYVVDKGNSTLREISPQGTVRTLAGQPLESGDQNGPADKAKLAKPNTVAVAPDGTIYVTDEETGAVRRITPAGRVSTFAKGWRQGFIGPLSNAANQVAEGSAVAVGQDGTVYVFQGALYAYSPGGRKRLLAGDPAAESGYVDGKGKQARFNNPGGLAVDARDNVYVADTHNHLIRRVTPQGEVSTIGDMHYEDAYRGYAPTNPNDRQSGIHFGGYRDGAGEQARFNNPSGLVVAPDGTIYVADTGNECIRVIREVK